MESLELNPSNIHFKAIDERDARHPSQLLTEVNVRHYSGRNRTPDLTTTNGEVDITDVAVGDRLEFYYNNIPLVSITIQYTVSKIIIEYHYYATDNDSLFLKGYMKFNNDPLGEVAVFILGTDYITHTDGDGFYTLVVVENTSGDYGTVTLYKSGIVNATLDLKLPNTRIDVFFVDGPGINSTDK